LHVVVNRSRFIDCSVELPSGSWDAQRLQHIDTREKQAESRGEHTGAQ
jgi:hypothetical protein